VKFMVFMPGNADSEAGVMPPTELFEEMGRFNDELAKAGVLLAAEGLQPTARGAKLRYDDEERRTVIDGPFTEAKEIVAGFWMIQASSLEEAVEWFKRAPIGGGVAVEIRPVFGPEDFGPELTQALKDAGQRTQELLDANNAAARD
jgi:hypothetical protein